MVKLRFNEELRGFGSANQTGSRVVQLAAGAKCARGIGHILPAAACPTSLPDLPCIPTRMLLLSCSQKHRHHPACVGHPASPPVHLSICPGLVHVPAPWQQAASPPLPSATLVCLSLCQQMLLLPGACTQHGSRVSTGKALQLVDNF